MIRQVTGSKSALLLQCGWSFDPARGEYEEPDENPERDIAAAYGSDFHAAMNGQLARDLGHGKKRAIDKDVLKHAKEAQGVLDRWLTREGWKKGKPIVRREHSYAYNVETGAARKCKPPRVEDHVYPDLGPEEIGQTLDLEIEQPKRILVLDYKTGADEEGKFAYPSRLPQLLSNALAATSCNKKKGGRVIGYEVHLAVLHAPVGLTPIVYADPPIELQCLWDYGRTLRDSFNMITSGYLRTGPECKYCPARGICPTRGSRLLEEADSILGAIAVRQQAIVLAQPPTPRAPAEGMDEGNDYALDRDPHALAPTTSDAILPRERQLGQLYEAVVLAEKTAHEIRKRLADERRKGFVPLLSDGRTLEFRQESYRNLSMIGMERMQGRAAAARKIAELEREGWIELLQREKLVPTKA